VSHHDLKVVPEVWDDLESGRKNFEVRFAGDREFSVGDQLRLREWRGDIGLPEGQKWTTEHGYSGREVTRRVTYILAGERWGLQRDYVVMALEFLP
jgi:hypothetical protein